MDDLPFRELIDAAPDGLVVCDQTGKILLVNAEAARMFGYARDELLGKSVDCLVPDSIRPRHHKHVAGYTGAPRLRPMGTGLDLLGSRKDGSAFPVEISLSPIQSTSGLLITAGIRDISDRRSLEGEKRRATAYLASAVEAVQDSFALFDENDRLVMINSMGRALFGSEPATSIVGLTFEEVVSAALARGAFDVRNEAPETFLARWTAYHRAASGTLDVRTSSGRYLRVTAHRTAEQGTVSVIADVTEDVQRSEELRAARQIAEAASEAKSEFLSSMSHELRTPLNSILGFAQLLERDRKNPLDSRQIERLQHVLRGGEHLLRLIDDVLDLSKIEAGGIAISLEPVNVPLVLADVVSTLEPMATRAQVQIEPVSVPEALPRSVADRMRLAQILMNLGSNAIKYGKPGGHVWFNVAVQARMIRITVIDDGIGIPDTKRHKLFEPFQRAGQETGPIEGTGIGLTISRRLAVMMGGNVGYSSALGAGSQFWVEVPIHRTETGTHQGDVAVSSDVSPLPVGSTLRHTIVYVEDNPSNIALMRAVIGELPGVELLTTPTAEIGLELIRARLPSIVIMDIDLPGRSGIEAAKQLGDWPETYMIPVVGLSAAALPNDTARAKEIGVDRYLTKPVKVAELLRVLEELLVHPT